MAIAFSNTIYSSVTESLSKKFTLTLYIVMVVMYVLRETYFGFNLTSYTEMVVMYVSRETYFGTWRVPSLRKGALACILS